MVDWRYVVGIPLLGVCIAFTFIYLDNQSDMRTMSKQEECAKFGMGYLYRSATPVGEFCAKGSELYPVHMECGKIDGRHRCEMFFIE